MVIFQQVNDQVIQGLKGVACYLNDALISERTKKDHLSNLEAVRKRSSDDGLRNRKVHIPAGLSRIPWINH